MRDRYLGPAPEQNEPDFRIISGIRGNIESRKALPRLAGLLVIASAALYACGGGGISPTVTAKPDNNIPRTPMVLTPIEPSPGIEGAAISKETNRANVEEMRRYLDELPDSNIKSFTIGWINKLFADLDADPAKNTIEIGGFNLPIGSPDIVISTHSNTWARATGSIRRKIPGEKTPDLPSYFTKVDESIFFPLIYRTPIDFVQFNYYAQETRFYNGIEPSIIIVLPDFASGVPADFIAFFRKFSFIKEAVVLAVEAQLLEDTITTMNQNNFATEVTTTSGEKVEIVTQTFGETVNIHGQTMAAIDLGSYVLAIVALEGDPSMTAYLLQTPGYQNVTSTIQQDFSVEDISDSEMLVTAMKYGLANPNLQRNLQFEGNPALLPR